MEEEEGGNELKTLSKLDTRLQDGVSLFSSLLGGGLDLSLWKEALPQPSLVVMERGKGAQGSEITLFAIVL